MSSRRRQVPWMHRRSRYLIAAVAALGILNTGYITASKLFGGEAACPTSGCEQVLSSSYAYVFGLPLSLFGLLAYIGMAIFALAPLFINPEKSKTLRTNLENWTWLLLFIGSTAMMVFSGYLMYIMFSQFVAKYGAAGLCFYCLGSAITALTLFVLTILGKAWEDAGQLLFTGIIVGMVTLVGTLGVYANEGGSSASAGGDPGPPIVAVSSQAEIDLAKHLTSIGAKMYGAYWCPHCHDQKELFGKEAFALLNYVECDPAGVNPQVEVCRAAGVQGYPTWEINGQTHSGTQSLNELADLSGYQGSRSFQNQ